MNSRKDTYYVVLKSGVTLQQLVELGIEIKDYAATQVLGRTQYEVMLAIPRDKFEAVKHLFVII